MVEVALIQYFPKVGFEVWITDVIEIGAGLGDVFDTREEALQYAMDYNTPIVDLSHVEMPDIDEDDHDELRNFLRQFIDISPHGDVLSIKRETE